MNTSVNATEIPAEDIKVGDIIPGWGRVTSVEIRNGSVYANVWTGTGQMWMAWDCYTTAMVEVA